MKRVFTIAPLALLGAAALFSFSELRTQPAIAHVQSGSATKFYRDHTYPLSFRYPSAWKAPSHGTVTTTPAGTVYEIRLAIPGGAADCKVTVVASPYALPPFTNGRVAKDPRGPDTFHYFHSRVAGHAAMHIDRWSGKTVDAIDTFVNAGHHGYAVRLITGLPPFPKSTVQGYNTVVRSLSLPFS